MEFNINNLENSKKVVVEKVNNAIKNAFDVGVFSSDFFAERVSYTDGVRMVEASKVRLNTINELRLALELISQLEGLEFFKEKKNIDECIAHENAHANKTEELKADLVGYEFALFKNGLKYFIENVSTISHIPEDWDEQKKIEALIQIVKAPMDYGEQLSEDDVRKINYLNKKYYATYSRKN